MKHVVSVSLDEKTIIEIREKLRGGKYRNKSHLVETAILELLNGGGGE